MRNYLLLAKNIQQTQLIRKYGRLWLNKKGKGFDCSLNQVIQKQYRTVKQNQRTEQIKSEDN